MSNPSASKDYLETHGVNKDLLISWSIQALHGLRGTLDLCGFLLSTRNLYLSRAFGRLKQGKVLWKKQGQSRLFWKGSLGTAPQRRGDQNLTARKHPDYKGKEDTLATGHRTQGWAGRQAGRWAGRR